MQLTFLFGTAASSLVAVSDESGLQVCSLLDECGLELTSLLAELEVNLGYVVNVGDMVTSFVVNTDDTVTSLVAGRRQAFSSRFKEACPAWLSEQDRARVVALYTLAHLLRVSGQQYVVDHIEPLNGLDRCGLHVPWNLQLLPDYVNDAKGWMPSDAWDEQYAFILNPVIK